MKKLWILMLLFSSLFAEGIIWQKDYEMAKKLSVEKSKPIFIVFVASSWCHWCQKMDKAVFQDTGFIEESQGSFIFYKVDVADGSEDPSQQALIDAYQVEGFPTVVIVDSAGRVLAKLGYVSMKGRQYAIYAKQSAGLAQSAFKGGSKGTELEEGSEMQAFDGVHPFAGGKYCSHAELYVMRYAALVKRGMGQTIECKELKRKIQTIDPNNVFGSWLKIAVVDFEDLCSKSAEPDQAIEPLIEYINLFGKKDRGHLCDLYLKMAKFLFTHERWGKGIEFAKLAFRYAPALMRKEIIDLILESQEKLESSPENAS